MTIRFYVAGLVRGVMLNDIWKWYDSGTETEQRISYCVLDAACGLLISCVIPRKIQSAESASFLTIGAEKICLPTRFAAIFPLGKKYLEDVKSLPILHFCCQIPLALADGTLNALMKGKEKMTRDDVNKTVNEVVDM